MSTEFIGRVFPGGIRAVNTAESGKLDNLLGKEVMVKVSQPRNVDHHRKFFALLETARAMVPEEYNRDQFRAIVTVGSGHCDFIPGVGLSAGRLVAVPRSISFGSMDQTEFSELYTNVLTFICEHWALDRDDLLELVEFM